MRLSIAIAVLWLLASNAFVPADARTADGSPFPRIVAHRGASADRPECTLSALRRAIDKSKGSGLFDLMIEVG